MLLDIIGLVALIVVTRFVFKTAKESGRNPFVWTLVSLALGLGLQQGVPFLYGFGFGLIWVVLGKPVSELQSALQWSGMIVERASLVISLVAIGVLQRYISRVPQADAVSPPPPPPPIFD